MLKKIVACALSVGLMTSVICSQVIALDSFDCPCPQIIAHRGASGDYPQGTELAFQKALEMGSDILELDVHLTGDGYVIVHHDADFSATAGVPGKINEMTLAEIKALDAGYMFTKDDGATYPYRGGGLQFLTLPEMIMLFPGERLLVEIKTDDNNLANKLWNIVQTHHLQGSIVVASEHSSVMTYFRDISHGEVYTGATVAEQIAAVFAYGFGFGWAFVPNYESIQMPKEIISKGFIRFLTEKGVYVHVWTLNEIDDIERAFNFGADAVIGDYPDRIYSVLEVRGDR